MKAPEQLLWLDLEMTGLDSQLDLIIDLAVIITDFDFKSLATYQAGIKQDGFKLQKLINNNPWFAQQGQAYCQQMLDKSLTGKPLNEVEGDVLGLCQQHITDSRIYLAGNSIHCDRNFIDRYMPRLANRLHYRMFDVSSFKIYAQAKLGLHFKKNKSHQASTDILESIAEIKFYLQALGGNND